MGGGSGGHITPPLAVAHKLKTKYKSLKIDFVIEKGSRFLDLPKESADVDTVHTIFAGKWRRYHGESFLQHLADIPSLLKNIRDLFLFGLGFIQSLFLLRRVRPDVVFIKGGFVGVPIGLVCALFKIPYLTHDSDALPGLANRIISKWAKMHLVGMPVEFYNYPEDRMQHVGVPVGDRFTALTETQVKRVRSKLNIPEKFRVLLITGGSLGAKRLNEAIQPVVEELVEEDEQLFVVHQTGEDEPRYRKNTRVSEQKFIPDMADYSNASDVIVSRAGATNIAEFAALSKPVVLVPNPQLTGGHQLKNAKQLRDAGAVEVISEPDVNSDQTVKLLRELLRDKNKRTKLGETLHKTVRTDATDEISTILGGFLYGDNGGK